MASVSVWRDAGFLGFGLALPKTTLWPLDSHTRGKHEVLKEYLNAWLPVLGSWAGRILFIDGFAGPGQYNDGEPGSPIIAIRALRDHNAKRAIRAEVGFIFIEQDESRAAHLQEVCNELKKDLPPKCWIDVARGSFGEELSDALDKLEEQKQRLAPSFVVVDPFGVSGIPMEMLGRILKNRYCEVFVSFMYESINRFKGRPQFEEHLDALFGSSDWRKALKIRDAEERRAFMYGLYRSQLKAAGAAQVVHLDLYEGRRLVYAIFFASGSPKGCDLMKRAIWRVAPLGDYAFRGLHVSRLGTGLFGVDFGPLQKSLRSKFKGKGWVPVEEFQSYVASDECDFHTGHLKGVLRSMEDEGTLEVDPNSRSRRNTYPDGTRIRITKP